MPGVPDRSDTATSQHAAVGALRDRVQWGMAAFFVLVMALVSAAVLTDAGDGAQGPIVMRLGILGLVIPLAMAALTRSIIGPATLLESMTSELRSLYSQARLDALLDPITGLGNHRAFQEELHRQIEDAGRHGHPVALALIDVDDLKRVNDEHGHAVGDQLLAAVGRLLAGSLRAADRAYRVGGDEFAVILPHADADAAHAVLRRILARAVSNDSTYGRAFSFSAGVSAHPAPSEDGRHLLANADAALYWAKRHGRTDVQIYDPDRHTATDERRSTMELAQAIDDVVARQAIFPLFQPIHDLTSGQPVGFEGLVRPTDGSGFRDATSLFTAAEQAERTVELDMMAIRTIAAALGEDLGSAYLSVNLSPRSLEASQFSVAEVVAALDAHRVSPAQVVLELTERERIEDMERLRRNVDACRAAGFRIAADDVGAGNAGLQLLSQITFDVVKIDLSLVRGGVLRDSAVAVLRAIQELAARSGASVVAEGIETVEQLEVIRRLGISSGQGYLLAAPRPELLADTVDVEALLTSHQARRRALLDGWDLLASLE